MSSQGVKKGRYIMLRIMVLLLVLIVPSLASAVPFEITGGTWFEGVPGGIRFDLFGENFSVRGTDSVSFAGHINGVNYAQTDFQLRRPISFGETLAQRNNIQIGQAGPETFIFANIIEREFSLTGTIIGGNPGGILDRFEVFGAGIATLSNILNPDGSLSSLVNTSLAFAPAVPEPGTWLLLLTGFGMLIWWADRTRQRFD